MSKTFNLLDINSVRPIVKLALKYKKIGKALDLGSGVGRHSLFLAKNGFKIIAIDNRSDVLAGLKELARIQKLPVRIEKVDAFTYKPKQKFDIILSNMLLHFAPEKDKVSMIQMMQKNTDKEGLNVISTYTNKNPQGLRPYLLKSGMLKKWYEKAGWRIVFYNEGLGQPVPDISNPKKKVRIWSEEIIAQKI